MKPAILNAIILAISCLCSFSIAQTNHADATQSTSSASQSGEAGQSAPDGNAPPASGAKAAANDKAYTIGPEDVLRIQVWGEPRLSGDFVVRGDGRISMNLINEVEASGKTPEELGLIIADRLKSGDFMKAPSVNVAVAQVNSKKYYINGEVNKPGAYSMAVPTRVLEALTNAGGFRDFANQKKIRILRMTKEGMKEFRFDYKAVTHGKNLEQNIYLEPGDQIIVP